MFRVAMLHAASEVSAQAQPAGPRLGAPIEDTVRELALWGVSGGLYGRVGTQLYRTVIAEAGHDPA